MPLKGSKMRESISKEKYQIDKHKSQIKKVTGSALLENPAKTEEKIFD